MSINYAILGLLHYQDMHGYRIKEHIERNFNHMWSINYGQIYPTLKKLQEQQLVEMVGEQGGGAPPRKVYRITEKGKSEFVEWLKCDPDKKMLLRDPFLLKFMFFEFGSKADAARIIADQLEEYRRQLQFREVNLGKRRRTNLFVGKLSELGVKLNRMMTEWLEECLEEVERADEADLCTSVGDNYEGEYHPHGK